MQVGDTLARGTVIGELDEGDLRRARVRVAQLEARVATARDNQGIARRNDDRYTGRGPGPVPLAFVLPAVLLSVTYSIQSRPHLHQMGCAGTTGQNRPNVPPIARQSPGIRHK